MKTKIKEMIPKWGPWSLILFFFITMAIADPPYNVTIGNGTGAPGSTGNAIAISVSSLPADIAGFQVYIKYDKNVLTPDTASLAINAAFSALAKPGSNWAKSANIQSIDATYNRLNIQLYDGNVAGTTASASSLNICTINFAVAANATTLNNALQVETTSPGLADISGNPVSTTWTSGNFQVTGLPTGTITLTPSPASIIADGTATTTITSAAIKDAAAANVPDGTKITVATNLGTITTSDADGTTPGIQVLTTGGVITFALQSNLTIGTATVTATSVSGDATGTVQVPFTGVPATSLVITGVASPITAGTAGNIQVKAVNAAGVTATGYTGKIHFTSTDPNAVLPADYTFTAGDAGTKVFTGGVTLKTKGTQSVAATDTATATITGTQSGIVVNAAPAAKISLTASPTTITSSVVSESTLTARILDAYDNLVDSFTSAVTFGVTATTYGDIKAGETSVNATAGVAISHVQSKIDPTGGTITCTADSGSLTQGTVNVTTLPFGILAPAFPLAPVRTGSQVTFTATGGSGSYQWQFSAGAPATAATKDVNWTAPAAAATVTVILTDANNASFTTQKTFSVYYLPDPTVTDVAATTGDNTPTMSWSAPTNAVKYDFQLATDAAMTNIVATQTGTANTSFTPTVALADGTYYWQVRAIDADNNTSGWVKGTAFTVDTTAPAAVTGLTVAQQTNGNLKLDWVNPTADFTGVIVVGATDAAPTLVPVNGTTYTVGNGVLYVGNLATYTETLAHGVHRYYKVFAYDSVKNYSAAAEAHAMSSDTLATAAPTAPAASAGNTQVTLSWTNPTDDFAGIVILMRQAAAPTGVPAAGTKYNAGDTIGDSTVAYAAYASTASTTTITGLTNNTKYYFAIYAVDERPNYSATAASADAIPGPPVISAPTLPAYVHVGDQLNFTATSGTGSYNWTATAGTLSADTGASVTWTAPATVVTSPTAVTVRVTDPTTSLYVEGTVNVYSIVAISGKPATPPTVLSGTISEAFTVAGGDGVYAWTVTGPVAVTGGAGSSFTFNAPATGGFAGEYTIEAADGKGGKDSFKVRVPFTLTPSSTTFKQNSPLTFTVGGAAGNFTWDIMSKSATDGTFTKVATPADYGTWANAGASDPTNVFTPAASITAVKTFYLQITVAGDTDLTADNGLNKQTFGPFQIIPVATYTVNVKKADGTALNGAVVAVQGQLDAAGQPLKATVANGKVTFALPDGGKYLYEISLANYVSQSVSSTDKTVNVTLQASAAAITGTVQDTAGAALVGAQVVAYLPASPLVQYKAETGVGGAFTINLPSGAAIAGWTVVAGKEGYAAVKLTGKDTTTPVAFTGANGLATAVAGAVSGGTGEKTATDLSGNSATVTVPAGGLAQDTAVIVIAPAAKDPAKESIYTEGSPDYVYEVKIQTAAGADLAAADIKRLVITLPIDLLVLKPGDLEKGVYSIYTAKTQADLEAGKGTAVPAANIIAVDYVGNGLVGSVTFWVDHLSFFGIGAGGGGTTSTSGCFIATAAYGSYFERHVEILRNFRDAHLLTNDWGRAFVGFYYRHSPALANFIAKNDGVRAVVRLGLAPVVGVAYVTIHTTPFQKVLMLLLLIGILTAGLAVIRRIRRTRRIAG